MKLRAGLLLAALILSGCDHHKSAQSDSGVAAVAQSDAALTGNSADANSGNKSPYPRAILVSLPPGYTPPKAQPVVAVSTTPSQPPDASSVAASSAPAPADSTPPLALAPHLSASPAPDTDMSRLTATPAAPVLTANPPLVAANNAPAQEHDVVVETPEGRIVI